MGQLDGAITYLSGAIECAADHGVGWRKQFINLTKTNGLKIAHIDPTNKPIEGTIQSREDQELQTNLQSTGRFEELQQYVQSYRHHDLRFVDYCDFMVVMIHPTIPQWGTANEIYVAENQHKPMFFVCEGGLYKLPRWLFGVIQIKDVYTSIEEVVKQLTLIDNNTIQLNNDWVLIEAVELH
jgi:hypothetical protein